MHLCCYHHPALSVPKPIYADDSPSLFTPLSALVLQRYVFYVSEGQLYNHWWGGIITQVFHKNGKWLSAPQQLLTPKDTQFLPSKRTIRSWKHTRIQNLCWSGKLCHREIGFWTVENSWGKGSWCVDLWEFKFNKNAVMNLSFGKSGCRSWQQ